MKYDRFERADATHDAVSFGLSPGVAGIQIEELADVFCRQCAQDILGEETFETVKERNAMTEEYGNAAAVLTSEEWDCPGANCGHCGISLDVSVIHYDVCDVDTCPLATRCEQCGTHLFHDDTACEVLNGQGSELGEAIVCTDCAREAGVDVAAFGQDLRRILQ